MGGILSEMAKSPHAEAERARRIRRWIRKGEARLVSRHPVLAHRDYHCRNLMVRDGRLRLIDYQDARMGRHSYDLASLLFDSYLELGEPLRARLLEHYQRRMPDLPADWRD